MATTKPTTAKKAPAKKTSQKKSTSKATQPEADIQISIDPPKPITVDLGGTRYTVRPIKGALGIALGQRMKSVKGDAGKLRETVEHLVEMIFGKSEAPGVLSRLDDPEDALDFQHVLELMNALVERSTGSPTT